MKEFGRYTDQAPVAEQWMGHSFSDACEWKVFEPEKVSARDVIARHKQEMDASQFALQAIRAYVAQPRREAIRSFDQAGDRFNAWDYYPGSIVKIQEKCVYSPFNTVSTFREEGMYLGVAVKVGQDAQNDGLLKIAVARDLDFGKKQNIKFDFLDPEIKVKEVMHTKTRLDVKTPREYQTLQDLTMYGSVHLLAIGRGQRISGSGGGTRQRTWNIFGALSARNK